jgi:GNAT superfamily N-acetyltransferase
MEFRLLTPADTPAYRSLTFPRYRDWLSDEVLEAGVTGIKVENEGQACGLALAKLAPDHQEARLASLVVVPECRGAGLGTTLLERLEAVLRQQGCQQMSVNYSSGQSTVPAFERILQKCAWGPPELVQIVSKGDRPSTERLRWLRLRLPAGFESFFWVNLPEDERQALQAEQVTKPWYPEYLSPFAGEELIDAVTSLGLRYQGQVVGWSICHRLTPDTTRHTSVFVRAELDGAGAGIPLLAESLRRVLADTPAQYLVFVVHAQNEPMLRFARRHIIPHMISSIEQRFARKIFYE